MIPSFSQPATNSSRGFALLIAMIVTATLLLVSTTVATIAVREAKLSSASVQSQYAFYAADTGVECAIYWDVKGVNGHSAFATSTGSTINCNNSGPLQVGGNSGGSSFFHLIYDSEPYCADVYVYKAPNGSTDIQSLGYNTCDSTNSRRVERAVEVIY